MWLVVTFIVVGTILLLLETLLPGAVAGIAGMVCLGLGVVMAYRDLGVESGNTVLVGVATGLLVGTMLWIKYFPNSRFIRRFASRSTSGEIRTERPEWLHQTGVAFTTLRPSGTALINNHRVDVVSEGPLIERGTPVKVIAQEGIRVVVRAT